MAKAPGFMWYPKDCDTDEHVRLMDDEELGFYLRCLNHSWLNYGLPEDLSEIARALKSPIAYVRKQWKRVGLCFVLASNNRLVNPKQEEQRQKQKATSETRSAAAASRWSSNADASAFASSFASVLQSFPLATATAAVANGNANGKTTTAEHCRISEFPQTAAAVRELDPTAEDALIAALVARCQDAYLPCGKGLLDDERLSAAVRECRKENQHSAGLYLKTVPQAIRTWLTWEAQSAS